MQRSIARLGCVLASAALAACGGEHPPAPHATVTAVELARELAADPDAAIAKYGGEVLEITGTAGEKVRPGGLDPTLGIAFEGLDERLRFDANLSFVSFDPDDAASRADFEAIRIGGPVRLHCTFRVLNAQARLFRVDDCRLAAGS